MDSCIRNKSSSLRFKENPDLTENSHSNPGYTNLIKCNIKIVIDELERGTFL